METMGTPDFEQAIRRLGLVSEAELAEIHEEIGEAPDLQHLIAALERKSYLTPWQRGKVLKGDLDGYILGGYRLLYKIQSGSFGRVYRAEDPRDGRVVAVKVLRRRWSDNQERIDMFIREGKVGLLLKHPNIVEVIAINRDPTSEQYYIVMEFVEGGNLREILQIRKKLSVAESVRIIEDCAAGLAYAYTRHMTHRDIKLTNVLVSSTGEAKLVDFGLAQFFSTLARTEDEKVDRTVDYAGLERGTGVKNNDVRSDIYFLGCVLYECLTGRSPLVMTRDKHARMRKGRFEEVQPINPGEIDGPAAVLLLVETMMALDPKERYQTPSQLLEAIRAVHREADGKKGKVRRRGAARSVFVAEPDEHLQDVLRDGLKDQGYRVFLAADPLRALDRFRQQPYDGLIVDARTTGEDGFRVFEHIVEEASRKRLSCAALVLLGEGQASWAARLPDSEQIGILINNITYKSVSRKLKELMEAAHGPEETLPSDAEEEADSPAVFNFSDAAAEKESAAPSHRHTREDAVPSHRHTHEDAAPAAWSQPHDSGESPFRRPEPRKYSSPAPMRHGSRDPLSGSSRAADLQALNNELALSAPKRKKDEPEKALGEFFAKFGLDQKRNLIGVVVVLLLIFGVYIGFQIPDKLTNSKYESIQPGMTEEEVKDILGEGEVVASGGGDATEGGGKKNEPPRPGTSIKSIKWVRGKTLIVVVFAGGTVTQKQRSD